jgi:hypothetical protein
LGIVAQLRLDPLGVIVCRRQRLRDRPAHHAPMNTELRGHPRNRTDTKLVLLKKLLEQIHFCFPVHKRHPDLIGVTVG